jgi:hypothetical protein
LRFICQIELLENKKMAEEGNKFIFENKSEFTILVQEDNGQYITVHPGEVICIAENRNATYSFVNQQFRKVLPNMNGSEMEEVTVLEANRPPTPHRNWAIPNQRHHPVRQYGPRTRHKKCLFITLFFSFVGFTCLLLFAHFT